MDDFLTEAQEEDVVGKIVWYNQQLIVVKDDFTRWLGELGYAVDVLEKPLTIHQGPCERYDSVCDKIKLFYRKRPAFDPAGLFLPKSG